MTEGKSKAELLALLNVSVAAAQGGPRSPA
jgi:hypothetical protein